MKRRICRGLSLVLLAGVSFSAGCRLYNLERRLNPVNADFLSKVRYIITREERKAFLELEDSEKPQFIEEFWKRRDPDPDTEENEFKIEYFNRIERATQLFPSEGMPGWLTDRGRIYVLFGPPTDRITQPVSGDAYTRCQEVWYYGNFPVVFVDQSCTGTYKLLTYELSGLRDINLMYMHELNMAQADAQKTFKEEKILFNFEASLKIKLREPERIEGVVVLEVLYERIWYKSEGKRLWTTLQAVLELKDAGKNMVWQHKADYDLNLDEAELEQKAGKKYTIEIPVVIDDKEKIRGLGQGQSFLTITLINTTGHETQKKTMEFK